MSMLRVKMSRRRSQSQKENRRKVHNLRRQLEGLPEQDASILDQSVAVFEVKVAPAKAVTTGEPNRPAFVGLKSLQCLLPFTAVFPQFLFQSIGRHYGVHVL